MSETFKAWMVENAGEPLKLTTYNPPPLGDDEVEIKTTHNGICQSDSHMQHNHFHASKFPFVPGHEVVGIVSAVGKDVKHIKIGDRVGAGWIKSSCGECRACRNGYGNLCEKGFAGLITMGSFGGLQPIMRVTSQFIYKIPDNLASEDAAPLMCAGSTVYNCLRRYVKYPGIKVGVIGIGGLGHLAVQFASKMGAEVTAISNSSNKEDEARSFGADKFVLLSEAKDKIPNYLDVLLTTVTYGHENGFEREMAILAKNGVLILAAFPPSPVSIDTNTLIGKQLTLTGTLNCGRKDNEEMLEFAVVKGIKPKVQKMPLSKVNEALQICGDGKARYRIVLETDIEN